MTSTKTLRLFISSTFSDFGVERRVLHEKVFPVIEQHLLDLKSGWQFQPIDLRWGVSTEAQLDQKTLELCLNEVRACKHFPHPNFLIMIGNRYGWVGLPYAIEKSEFDQILAQYQENPDAVKMLEEWYQEDTNHLISDSHAYVLKERDPKSPYAKWEGWEPVENALRSLLQEAAESIFTDKQDPQFRKYFLSATEAEVEEGIFQYLNATTYQSRLNDEAKKEGKNLPELDQQYVHGWIREITNIKEPFDYAQEPVKSYIDKDQSRVDAFKDNLKASIISDNLGTGSITLQTDPEHPINDTEYLKTFEAFMLKQIKASIEHQINEAQDMSPLTQERREQLRFRTLKTESFCGRSQELSSIEEYRLSASNQPLIVHGISGIGKSSIIAKAIADAEMSLSYSAFSYRFIGATASSSSIRPLLESLIEDLDAQGVLVKPEIFESDINQFYTQIKELLSQIEKPTLIVLDALDQLKSNNYLMWIPLELPENLKIVLSMLDQEGYDHYYRLLANKIDQTNQIEIKPLIEEGIAKDILKALLEKEDRSLTDDQFKYILKQYEANGSSPLYLKIAFEEAKLWKSTDTNETLSNEKVQGIIKEFIDNLSKKHHHPKPIVHKILGLIAASRDGLSEKELLDLLCRNKEMMKIVSNEYWGISKSGNEERFPLSVWARLHNQLSLFLNERLIDGQNLITFFHRQITEAINDYIYKPDKEALHTELANYFLTLQDKDQTWDKRYYNPHMFTESPYQLFHAKDRERLKAILFDLEFAGSVYDHHKHDSFKSIMEQATQLEGITQDDIYPWESFYREKDHLIFKVDEELWRPHQSLFQLAYEDGDNSPLSEKAEKLLAKERVTFHWLKCNNRTEHYSRSGLIKVLHGHTGWIEGAKILENGRIISWSSDNTLRLWSPEGEPLAVMEGHQDAIQNVEILSAGIILSSDSKRNHFLWNSDGIMIAAYGTKVPVYESNINLLSNGRCLFKHNDTFHLLNEYGDMLPAMKGFSGNLKYVKSFDQGSMISCEKEKLCFWNNDGKLLKTIQTDDIIKGFYLLEDRRILLLHSGNKLSLWDAGKLFQFTSDMKISKIKKIYALENGRIFILLKESKTDHFLLQIWNSHGDVLTDNEYFPDNVCTQKLDDGRIILYYDEIIHLWSASGAKYVEMLGHTAPVQGIKVLKNNQILSWSQDKTLRLWSCNGDLLCVMSKHIGWISGVNIMDDGKILSWASDASIKASHTRWQTLKDRSICLWTPDGDILTVFEGHTGEIVGTEVLRNNQILSWSKDNTLRIWNVDIKFESAKTSIHHNIDWMPFLDNEKIVSCLSNGMIQIHSSCGELLMIMNGHSDKIIKFITLKDGKILTASHDQTIRIWSDKGQAISVMQGHTDTISHVSILENDQILSWSWKDMSIRLWNTNGNLIALMEGHSDVIKDVLILDNGTFLSWSIDNTICLWDSQGNLLSTMIHEQTIRQVKVFKNGRIVSLTSDRFSKIDCEILFWSMEGQLSGEITRNHIDKMYVLHNNHLLLFGREQIELLNSEGEFLGALDLDAEKVNHIEILEDSRVVLRLYDGGIHIYSEDGNELVAYKGHSDGILDLEVLGNDRFLSWSKDNTIQMWDSSGMSLALMKGHTDEILEVEILENGHFLSWSKDKTVRIWNSGGDQLAVIDGHSDEILHIEKLEDDLFLSWAKDRTLRLLNTNTATTVVAAIPLENVNLTDIGLRSIGYSKNHILQYDLYYNQSQIG